jgi:hypothetical protein
MKLTPDRITDYKAPTAEEASNAKKAAEAPTDRQLSGEGVPGNDKGEWAKLPADYKGVRGAAETETALSRTPVHDARLYARECVYHRHENR